MRLSERVVMTDLRERIFSGWINYGEDKVLETTEKYYVTYRYKGLNSISGNYQTGVGWKG